MKKLVAAALLMLCVASLAAGQRVRFALRGDLEEEAWVDVTIGGKAFTTLRWAANVGRPFLWPVTAANGAVVTRGFPLAPRPGDSVDHPHQVGASLSFGDVNGIDFWNWSMARTNEELGRMGRIVMFGGPMLKPGKRSGEIVYDASWVGPGDRVVLREKTRLEFFADGTTRGVDRETKLTANRDVVFGDNKEGFFAIRVARELEQADQAAVKVIGADGVEIVDGKSPAGLTGNYFTSEGFTGNAAWGTTGRWAAVAGGVGGREVTVVVMDDPRNFGAPASMMVRGYGLLALNPFGRKAFDPKAEARRFELAAQKSVVFRHRLLVMSGKADAAAVEREFKKFEKKVK